MSLHNRINPFVIFAVMFSGVAGHHGSSLQFWGGRLSHLESGEGYFERVREVREWMLGVGQAYSCIGVSLLLVGVYVFVVDLLRKESPTPSRPSWLQEAWEQASEEERTAFLAGLSEQQRQQLGRTQASSARA